MLITARFPLANRRNWQTSVLLETPHTWQGFVGSSRFSPHNPAPLRRSPWTFWWKWLSIRAAVFPSVIMQIVDKLLQLRKLYFNNFQIQRLKIRFDVCVEIPGISRIATAASVFFVHPCGCLIHTMLSAPLMWNLLSQRIRLHNIRNYLTYIPQNNIRAVLQPLHKNAV